MAHKCDRCDREATVTDTVKVDGKFVELHLCEQCARAAGIAVAASPLEKLMTSFVMQQVAGLASEGERPVVNACPQCGLAYAEFRQKGLLGCPGCYAAFETQLSPLIERAHQGATHHCGKSPARGTPPEQLQQRIAALRKQLDDAVRKEQYERAVGLRDEINKAMARHAPRGPGGHG